MRILSTTNVIPAILPAKQIATLLESGDIFSVLFFWNPFRNDYKPSFFLRNMIAAS